MSLIRDIRVQASFLLLVFIVAYHVPLQAIVHTWMSNDDYSYGFLIPVISAYLLWEKRRELSTIDYRMYWPVFPLLLSAVAVSVYGILGSSGNVSMMAVPLLVLLFAAFCFGIRATRHLLLPLGFLFFMVPVPAFIERSLGVYLKSVSSRLGGCFIDLAGIPVHVSGNIIDLGVTQLQVVDACSGLRYLLPLVALGVIYAYFFERAYWKRVVCVAATIPIALLINVLRIGITGVLTEKFGPSMAEGFFHDFSGWVMFLVAFVLLVALGRLLALFPAKAAQGPAGGGTRVQAERDRPMAGAGRTTPAFILSFTLLLLVAALSFGAATLPPVNLKNGLGAFPLSFAGWQGAQLPVARDEVEESGAEEAFYGAYRNLQGETASLYIGYRSSAFLENENYFHTPTVCLPSSGWKVIEERTRVLSDVPFWGELKVTEMVVSSMGTRQLVYFWFQTKDRTSHNKDINRLHLSLHALSHDNTYALFLRPILAIDGDEPLEQAERRLDAFARAMLAAAMDFFETQTY